MSAIGPPLQRYAEWCLGRVPNRNTQLQIAMVYCQRPASVTPEEWWSIWRANAVAHMALIAVVESAEANGLDRLKTYVAELDAQNGFLRGLIHEVKAVQS